MKQQGIEYNTPGTYPPPSPTPSATNDTPDFWFVDPTHIHPNNDIVILRDHSSTWGICDLGTCSAKWQKANRFTGWLYTGTSPSIVATAQNNPFDYALFAGGATVTLGSGNPITMPITGVKTWDWTGHLFIPCIPIAIDTWVPLIRSSDVLASIKASTGVDFAGVASDMGFWAGGSNPGVNWQYSVGVDLDAP
jgi:hypothetical protein